MKRTEMAAGFMCPVRQCGVILACLFLISTGSAQAVGPIPYLGGTPDMRAGMTFGAGSGTGAWQADVFSYAYVGTAGADPIPSSTPALPDPAVGQTLFMYVIKMSDNPGVYPGAVNQLNVGNPIPAMVPDLGYDPMIVPNQGQADEFKGQRQSPSQVFSSLDARSVSYYFDSGFTLNPSSSPEGEFTVLYFLADGTPDFVDATVIGGAATFDEHGVLGPVPEPGVAGLVLLGGCLMMRRRRGRQ